MNIQIMIVMMVFVYLSASAYWDFRYKRIPWCVQGMGFVFMCICIMAQWKEINLYYFLAYIPGIFLLMLAWITKENVGYGDGISVFLLGGMVGFRNCIWVLCISMILLSFVGVIMLLIKRANRKTKIPYLPFLFVAESLFTLLQFV